MYIVLVEMFEDSMQQSISRAMSIFLDDEIGAQEKNSVHGIINDDERFWDIFNVERPHNTAGTSMLVSTADAEVETTIVGDQNSDQK